MARSVTDVALLLSVLAGPDDNDPATAKQPPGLDTDYTKGLRADGLRGARIGVLSCRRCSHFHAPCLFTRRITKETIIQLLDARE
jgi:amidase